MNILDILQESRHRDKNNILDVEYECRSRIFDFVLYYEIKHYIRYVLFTPEGKICNRPCLSLYFGLSGNEHSYTKVCKRFSRNIVGLRTTVMKRID